MATQTLYDVMLTGALPFSAVDVPGENPTVQVGRTERTRLTKAQLGKLKKAAGEGALSDLTEANLDVSEAEVEVNATKGAIAAANKQGVSLAGAEGSGSDGKVTKGDVTGDSE